MQDKPKLVALGLYVPGTSFTRVFDSLFSRLSDSFEIHWQGIAYKGPVRQCDHYILHPNNQEGGDIFGTYGSARLADQLQADIVLFINDVWMMKNYSDVHGDKPWRTVAYVPLDGRITNPTDLLGLCFLDTIVAYHEDAHNQFTQALRDLVSDNIIHSSPSVEIAYHGVDTEVFTVDEHIVRDVDKRLSYKRRFFGHIDNWENTLFILNANRFNERKDLKTTVTGYAEALNMMERPTRLCLHVPSIEDLHLAELKGWISEFNVEEHVLVNPASDHGYVDDQTLKELYIACDIGINTSFGEGWGLISFEHGACGGAQIMPAQSGLQDIWRDNALFIERAGAITLPTNPFEMQQSAAASLAEHLVRLVDDPALLQEMQLKAYRHVHLPEFRWESVAEQWRGILKGEGGG